MKKSLFALAALGAFAGAASAQSSVTLYGAFDVSAGYISNGGVDLSTTNTSIAKGTSTPSTAGNQIALVDGAFTTSIWGMKGVEDLGGGMKAMFEAESDILANNGTTHSSGLFRRAANVGINGGFGSIYLGLKGNPLTAASGTALPVEGNTVHSVRSTIGYNSTDYIKNGFQYESPNLGGFVARLAYGASNTVGDSGDGTIMAASAIYTMGNARVHAAYNKASAGNAALTTGGTAWDFTSAAQSGLYDQMGWVAGAKYAMGAFSIGAQFAHGEQTAYAAGNTTATKTANANATMVGLGYQASPALLLGANYTVTTADSSMYNLQAHYALSKRTTVYAQGTMTQNGKGAWSNGDAYGNFMPINTNSSTAPKNIGGYGLVSGGSFSGGLPNTNGTAVNVGVIHKF
jgi:predicted porin